MLTDLVTKANAGSTIQELADSLATDAAFTSGFPIWMTSKEFTTKVVNSMFAGSTVAQADTDAAIDYIAGMITAGTFTKTSAVVALTSYLASADGVANATYGSAAQSYQNKVEVAEYYTITKGLGDATAAERKAAIAGVTSEASSVTSEKASADTAATVTAAIPAKTLTLTSGQDNLSGGLGDDTFTANLAGAGAAGSTVQPGDIVAGGAGEDALTIAVAGDGGGAYTLQAVTATGVEHLNVSNFDANVADTTVDTVLMSGLEKVALTASSGNGDTIFDNVANVVDLSATNGSADVTLTYTTAATTGTQTQNIDVSNYTGQVTVAGVETVNLSSGLVKSTLSDLVINGASALNVTGSSNLTITGDVDFKDATSATAIDGTVDASAFTGKLAVAANTGDIVSITGGTGADTITMSSGLTKSDVIVGGDGADTLKMTPAALTTQLAQVSGVETVQFDDSGAAQTIDASKLPADMASIVLLLKDDATGADNLVSTVSNLTTQTVTLTRADEDADVDGQLDLTITNKTDSAADAVSVNVLAIGANGDEAADTDGDELGMGILDVANFETVNLGSLASTTIAANEMMQLTATSATAVNVTGTAGTTITAFSAPALKTLDASGLAGALTTTLSAGKVAVSMGQKSSTVNFGTSLNASDSIVGGAGIADTVTATFSGATATTSAVTMSGVEALMLTTGGNNAINLANVTGLGQLGVSANTQVITGFDTATTIEASGAATVSVTAADATGSDDTLKFRQKLDGNVDNVIQATAGFEKLSIDVRDTGATANTAGFNLTKFYGTDVTYAQNALSATAVVVDHAGTALYKTVDTVNATGLKAAFTASAANATNAVTFNVQGGGVQTLTGSAKGDTFNIGSTAAVAHAITGGTGTDTTNLTVATNLADVGTIDTENVNLTVPAAVSATLTTSFGTGVDNVTVTGGNSLSTIALGTIVTEVKTVDASGLAGRVTATIANDALDSTVTITGASALTDAVTTSFATAATTYSMVSSGIEALVVAATPAATTTVNLSKATGLGQITVSQGNTATQTFTLAGLTGAETIVLQASDDATAAANEHILAASLADATGTSDSIKFKVGSGTIDDGARLQTADIETVSINSDAASTLDLTNLSMTAAGKTMTLNVTGDSALTIAGLGTDVTTIDASAMSVGGSVVQTTRATTGTVNYTGSDGGDTFILANFGDTLVGGAGSDTLDINYAAILGGINIDMSSTTNQVVSANGSATSGSATGFENVDLSGYTGSFGALITSGSTALAPSSITGTANADQMVLSSGVDTINFAVAGSGGSDSISSFGTGTIKDILEVSAVDTNFNAALKIATMNAAGAITSIANTATAGDIDVVIMADGGLASAGDIRTEGNSVAGAITDADGALYIALNTTSGNVEVYHNSDESAAGGTMTLIGSLPGVAIADLAAGNFS
jgi:S-layer protein